MTTTNLSITSFVTDPFTGDMDCIVTAVAPLYIKELLLSPIANLGPPSGHVRPGTSAKPVVRTLGVDSSNSVFHQTGAFMLAVTYDGNYIVQALQPTTLQSHVALGSNTASPNPV